MAKSTKPIVIIFVEGETEKEFYEFLISYYRQHSTSELHRFKVFNMGGISRFETKMSLKLQNDILKREKAKDIKVVCCYDTDVFELAKKPPVNWKLVKDKVSALGISSFEQIKAKRMIEDWFLCDLDGIYGYLKVKDVKAVDGKDGNAKMIKLFKKGNKLYIKGGYTKKFIPSLNIAKIRLAVHDQLQALEKSLGFKMPENGGKSIKKKNK